MPGRTLKKLLQGRGEGKQEEQAYFLAINFTLEQRASQTLTAPSMLTQSRKGRLDLVQLEIARLSIRNFYFYHSISLPFNIFGFFGVFFSAGDLFPHTLSNRYVLVINTKQELLMLI